MQFEYSPKFSERIWDKIIFSFAAAIFVVCAIQKIRYSPDDTYIYLQYARNIAAGKGFAFNPGEPSLGVTGPLWALVLSLAYLFNLDGFWFSKIADLISCLLSFFVFFKLSQKIFHKELNLSLLALSIFIVNPWYIRSSFTGMETNFGVLLILLIFYFFYTNKYELVFFLLGVIYMVRPETFLLFFILLASVTSADIKQGQFRFVKTMKYIAITSSIMIPFFIYAHLNFESILPNTVSGKSKPSFNIQSVFENAINVFKVLASFSPIEIAFAFISLLLLFRQKSLKIYSPLLVWTAGLVTLYIITNSAVQSRYFLMSYPFIVLVGMNIFEFRFFKTKLLKLIAFIIVGLYSQFIFYEYVRKYADNFTRGVEECLIPIGEWLNSNTPKNSRILVSDVGAIGYYSNRYITDAAGLINGDITLNKKILSRPLIEQEYTRHMLSFIDCDYIVEKDSLVEMSTVGNRLKYETGFEFPGQTVFFGRPKYFKVYKVNN